MIPEHDRTTASAGGGDFSEPWLKLRGGLARHFADGRLNETTGFLFFRLLLAVNAEGFPASGVVWTSAADVAHRLCPSWSLKKAQDALTSLEAGGYIRRWREAGSRGAYPVMIHRWEVVRGRTQGSRVNAWASTSYKTPTLDDGTREVTPIGDTDGGYGEGIREGDTVLKRESKRKRKNDGASLSSSGNPEAGAGGHERVDSLDPSEARTASKPSPRAQELLGAFDAALVASGLPADTRSAQARRRALEAAERAAATVPDATAEDFAAAARAALGDRYLRDRGFPFELFAAAAPRYVRAARAGAATRSTSDDLDARLAELDRS